MAKIHDHRSAFAFAVRHNDRDTIDWLVSSGFTIGVNEVTMTAYNKYYDMARYLNTKYNVGVDIEKVIEDARKKHTVVNTSNGPAILVKQPRVIPNLKSMETASQKWNALKAFEPVEMMHIAIKQNDVDVIKLVLHHYTRFPVITPNKVLINAATEGKYDVVKYVLTLPGTNPAMCDNAPIKEAASRGHLDVVCLLETTPGVVVDRDVICAAALGGQNGVVMYLASAHSARIDKLIDDSMVLQVALHGNADMARALIYISGRKHLERLIVRYQARDNDPNTVKVTA